MWKSGTQLPPPFRTPLPPEICNWICHVKNLDRQPAETPPLVWMSSRYKWFFFIWKASLRCSTSVSKVFDKIMNLHLNVLNLIFLCPPFPIQAGVSYNVWAILLIAFTMNCRLICIFLAYNYFVRFHKVHMYFILTMSTLLWGKLDSLNSHGWACRYHNLNRNIKIFIWLDMTGFPFPLNILYSLNHW